VYYETILFTRFYTIKNVFGIYVKLYEIFQGYFTIIIIIYFILLAAEVWCTIVMDATRTKNMTVPRIIFDNLFIASKFFTLKLKI